MRNAIIGLTVAAVFLASCAKQPATVSRTKADVPPSPDVTAVLNPPVRPPELDTRLPSDTGAPPVRPPEDRRPVRLDPNDLRERSELADIHFDLDRYDLRPDAVRTLDRSAAWLREHPRELVLIEGHCDERGTNEYNIALGERRAKTALNYLVAQGVAANRLSLVSYGEERPACTERTEACWARNRRARFLTKPG